MLKRVLLMSLAISPGMLASPQAALGATTLHTFNSVAIAPDGLHVASTESEDDGSNRDLPALVRIRDLKGGVVTVGLPCESGRNCVRAVS